MKIFFLLLSYFIVGLSGTANAGFIEYPTVKLQALDKATARTITFEAKVGSTIEYGSVFIKVQACRKAEPLDTPEDAAFLQIWEVPINSDKSEWIFSGWMFSSSPALSAMDHPVYDVWVLDCVTEEGEETPSSPVTQDASTADQQESADENVKGATQEVSDATSEQDEPTASSTQSESSETAISE